MTLPHPLDLSRHWRDLYDPLLTHLCETGNAAWAGQLQNQLLQRFVSHPHGDLERWQNAYNGLPVSAAAKVLPNRSAVAVTANEPDQPDMRLGSLQPELEHALRGLMPWRKGPFEFFGLSVDTEWRSDWKWDRVAPHLSDLTGRTVLDVGCGSGYHCWRMWGAGASRVIGIDPGLLFLMQFLSLKRYDNAAPVDLLPIRVEDLPPDMAYFDTVFSMGILYHRRSPIDHLLDLKATLKPGGEVVLETLVIAGNEGEVLMPEDRYAMMRNVWFIPSSRSLKRWLARAGFVDIRVVDESLTSTEEQRATDWMQFQSLSDFLDPSDPSKTAEGYPAPLRATLIARKPR
ncbi:tRNA 5-methoxyuridine(34)/uridine 5-oxyacetic acid(34) synthase CmoB [Hydrocarboniclastica marina]|uniref:tRNA U34 carboxymethyltransferase n=1 Tax=Hydrocarboniclastica marina TaxID=2259620 RepID=A0A4P7XIQ5_9ALTE|nr:tRNA 5-methoxyuridine(34)/uridine 5-oxyacetic acid(34) synthase CmoB [Hydrocarboniclastica marina]QCF26613.1 tRNA 5-methoxyuridine(34)/uridine 5-oxyacetic acid(34) synthase CmoB [Hydrocarboniclastica marina]